MSTWVYLILLGWGCFMLGFLVAALLGANRRYKV
jgi:hypothetical protein